jgi:hypothetical protein
MPTAQLPEVRDAELKDIAERRKKVHEPNNSDAVEGNLVGFAFSGGGVRSASFSLGLLQALFRWGLLKHIDYLSTVSGGGYVGGYLASLILTLGKDSEGKAAKVAPDNPVLLKQLRVPTGQPKRVIKFIRHGKYLNRPRQFWSQYLIGLLLNNLVIFSGLACVCMAFATAWRVLDTNTVIGFLYRYESLGRLRTEAYRPFLPAILCFIAWLVVWIVSYLKSACTGCRPKSRLAKWLLVSTGISFLIGLAVLLATPVISIPQPLDDVPPTQPTVEISGTQTIVMISIIALVAIGLTPFLQPRRLLRSGIHPKSFWERRVFRIATTALLIGVPFVLIWLFAHHDFARKDQEKRKTGLLVGDFNPRTWEDFWDRVKVEKERAKYKRGPNGHKLPGEFIWDALAADPDVGHFFKGDKNEFEGLKTLGKFPDNYPEPKDDQQSKSKQAIITALNNKVIDGKSDFTNNVIPILWGDAHPGGGGEVGRQESMDLWLRHRADRYRIKVLVDRRWHGQLLEKEQKELNRLLLEVSYPDEVYPLARVYRMNVIEEDQKARLGWLLGLFIVFVVAGFVNFNATSLHSFYRDRLADMFLEPVANGDRTVRLENLSTTSHGGPYMLFSATLNRKPDERDPSMQSPSPMPPNVPQSTQPSPPNPSVPEHPGETPTDSFLFSRRYCGCDRLGYQLTGEYLGGRVELDDTMAISGAAFSPVQTSNPFIGFLMTIFNLRLGQWLPNPEPKWAPRWAPARLAPLAHQLLWDWLLDWLLDRLLDWRRSDERSWHFITDGGHHDNLGVWPLLQRRCRLIIVSDASQDGRSQFADLLRVVRRARLEEGILIGSPDAHECSQFAEARDEVVPLLSLLFPRRAMAEGSAEDNRELAISDVPNVRGSRRHFFITRIQYPPAPGETVNEGYLIYLKPTLTGDEPADLLGYAAHNADFPHNPTLDQLYDEDRFESYRQLGEHIGNQLCQELRGAEGTGDLWGWNLGSEQLLNCRGILDNQRDAMANTRGE